MTWKHLHLHRLKLLLGIIALCFLTGCRVHRDNVKSARLSLHVGMTWNQGVENLLIASGARPFHCGYSHGREAAFHIDAAYLSQLNKATISTELREALSKSSAGLFGKGWRPSESATIEVVTEGHEWAVIDPSRVSFYVQTGLELDTNEEGRWTVRLNEKALGVYRSSPLEAVSYWTLPNGLSMGVYTDKWHKDDPLRVTTLIFANSTTLFACKGESWYSGLEAELDNGQCELKTTSAAPMPVYLWKGMTENAATDALDLAGLKKLPLDKTWTTPLLKSGQWLRYSLDNDAELLVNIHSEPNCHSPTIRWIIIEATKPASADQRPAKCRIECELIDTKNALQDSWHWAFHQDLSWDPGAPERAQQLRLQGQQR